MNDEKVTCVICKGSSQCLKCENKQLKQQLEEANKELLKFYTTDTLNKLYISSYKMNFANERIKQVDKPISFEYESRINQAYFLTITFDPAKFGLASYEEQRKDYIIYHIGYCTKYVFIKDIYGCFEYHKNGIVHSHAIVITEEPEYLKKYLTKQFTDNPHNRAAIQLDKAKFPQAKKYIEKESKHYYYNSHFSRSEEVPKVYEVDIAAQREECPKAPLPRSFDYPSIAYDNENYQKVLKKKGIVQFKVFK